MGTALNANLIHQVRFGDSFSHNPGVLNTARDSRWFFTLWADHLASGAGLEKMREQWQKQRPSSCVIDEQIPESQGTR